MYDDNDDIEYLDREDRVANEKLERVGGVFVEPQKIGGRLQQRGSRVRPG